MGRVRLCLAVAMLVGMFGIPKTASAYSSSCSTFTITSINAGCTYEATGPGEYRAITASGWQISISRSGGPYVIVLQSVQSGCLLPPLGAVSAGSIPSLAGDLVQLSIKTACFNGVPPTATTSLRFQAGYIGGGVASTPSVPSVPAVNPMAPLNSCVAKDIIPATTPGALSCTYTATTAVGEVIHATPNTVQVWITDGMGGKVSRVYNQSISPPGRATFGQPVGAVMLLIVGPDSPGGGVFGSIGIVAAGDAP